MVSLGLYSHYWLLIHFSGFESSSSALLCMLICRAMFSVPYIHVNIFQVRRVRLIISFGSKRLICFSSFVQNEVRARLV